MKRRTKFFIVIALLIICLINVLAYIGINRISNSIFDIIGRADLAYDTPLDYLKFIKGLQKKPEKDDYNNMYHDLVSDKSYDFITAAFKQDDERIMELLYPSTKYIRSKDGSSFLRYIENGIHIEGYMATDKKLIRAEKKWCIEGDDHTITCGMEVYIMDSKSPQLWYLHFKKLNDDWKVYMLENDV